MKFTNCQKRSFIFLTIVVLFMCIGSFYDYQISLALHNESNLFGIFFAAFGQFPARICLSVAGTLLIALKEKKFNTYFYYMIGFLLNIIAIYYCAKDFIHYMNMNPILSLIITILIITICNFFILHITKETNQQEIKKYIILLIATIILQLLIVNMIKVPWSRPRMRMISKVPEANFQPWWVIGCANREVIQQLGIANEEFKSFPSGHTASAACICLLDTLPILNNKLKDKENLLYTIGFVFILMVALSRIIVGAHFLTDVTVGMLISVGIEYVLIKVLWRK